MTGDDFLASPNAESSVEMTDYHATIAAFHVSACNGIRSSCVCMSHDYVIDTASNGTDGPCARELRPREHPGATGHRP
jgi:hypothetical protein